MGNSTVGIWADGSVEKVAIHALVGGLLSKAEGGSFATGAAAAGANEALVSYLNTALGSDPRYLVAASQIVGVLAASAVNGDVQKGASIAESSTDFNFLGDHSNAARAALRQAITDNPRSPADAVALVSVEKADQRSDALLAQFEKSPGSMSSKDMADLAGYLQVYVYEQTNEHGADAAKAMLNNLLSEDSPHDYTFSYAGTEATRQAETREREDQVGFFSNLFNQRTASDNETLYNEAQQTIRLDNQQAADGEVGNQAIYLLEGPLGAAIRVAALAGSSYQAGKGAAQIINGDAWEGAGNVVAGVLGAVGGAAGTMGMAAGSGQVLSGFGLAESAAGRAVSAGDLLESGAAGGATKGITSIPDWSSSGGLYSGKLGGDYTFEPITFTGSGVGADSAGAGARVSNGVVLDPRLPDPEAGLSYQPTILNSANANIANSHLNGYVSELELANTVADLPNETVLKYGDAIGRNGSDIISVNSETGEVTLWDSKYRSGAVDVKQSLTFSQTDPLRNALNEAIDAVKNSNLSESLRSSALQKLRGGDFNTNTVGAGAAKNSVSVKYCGGNPC